MTRDRTRQHTLGIRALAVAALTVIVTLTTGGPTLAAGGATASADASTVTWGTAPTDNEVGTGRPNFGYDAHAGGTLRDAIDVINRGEQPIQLKVYASDAFTTATGALDLLTADQSPADVGTWITLDSSTVTVPADSVVSVPFTLNVPPNATPGDHTGGIVTSLVTPGSTDQLGVDRRIGSRVYLRVAGDLAPGLVVSQVHATYHGSLNPLAAGTADVTYTVTNTGNVRLRAEQAIRVAGLLGALAATANPEDLPELLPGGSLTLVQTVDGVWPALRIEGAVTLVPYSTVTGAAQPLPAVAATATTWALPWGQLLVFTVALAVAWCVRAARRRRRSATAAAIDTAVAQALQAAGAEPRGDA